MRSMTLRTASSSSRFRLRDGRGFCWPVGANASAGVAASCSGVPGAASAAAAAAAAARRASAVRRISAAEMP
jgi:hypothetical protein